MKKAAILLLIASLTISIGAPAFTSTKKLTALAPDGVSLSYTVQGKGEPTLVFVHCWCCDKSYWDNQVPYFEKKHRVVTVDLGGHGESGPGRKEWTIESFGADVAAVVKALGPKRVILIGHSMGGEVNIEAARLLGGRVLGLVGVDTYRDFTEKIPAEQRDKYLASFAADFPRTTNMFVRSMFPAGADSALVSRIASDMASAPPEVGIAAMRSIMGYDHAAALKELTLPIWSINTDRWPTNVEGNRKLARSFDVKYMQGRGHFVQLEDPAAFNALLEETIGEIVKGK